MIQTERVSIMHITYIFHSCYIVETSNYILVFDYFKGTLPSFNNHKKIIFLVSHIHKDHFNKVIFEYAKEYSNVSYIIDKAVNLEDNVEGIKVEGNCEYDYQGMHIQTLTSTDEGVAFYIEVDGYKLYHAGDLNWWHWEGESKADNDWHAYAFHIQIEALKEKNLDVAFIPLDPRQDQNAWWGFLDVLNACEIKHVFPMHFGKNIKKMQEYLHLEELQPYANHIEKVEYVNQTFEFDDI